MFRQSDLCIILFIYVINNNSGITTLVRILIAAFLLFLYSFNYWLKQFLNLLARLVASVYKFDVLGVLSSIDKANKFSLRRIIKKLHQPPVTHT